MNQEISEATRFLHEAEMGLGAWSWGDRTMWNYGHGYTDTDIEAGFRICLEAGVNLVDTAEVYGSGRSESLLGQFLKTTPTRVLVATKYMPFPWRLRRSALARSLDRSLERLGVEAVDLYQIHWPFPPMPVEFWVEGLAEAVKSGKARSVGVSNYNKAQMQKAHAVLAAAGLPLASNQVEYHLLNRSVEKNGMLELCQKLGVRLIAYSPLAKGLLTGKYTQKNPPPGLRGRQYASVQKTLPGLISLMQEIGKGHGGKTAAQVALNWVICKGALPIPGAKTSQQAGQNVGAKGWRLSPEEIKALDLASDPFIR
jgi:aryl-alcohol dehydrogenase-like predicted oxidoreductase